MKVHHSRDVLVVTVATLLVLSVAACDKAGDSGATSGSAGPSAASGLLGTPASGIMSSPASGVMGKASDSNQ
jgi:hypothetical protein